jgi:hypothetical protein
MPICGLAASAVAEAKLLADGAVTEDDLAGGTVPAVPRVAYALLENGKEGDVVELQFGSEKRSLLTNTETLAEDMPLFLLLAGKPGVPAGGSPGDWKYLAKVKNTRDGETLIEQSTEPIPFE